MQLVTGSYEGRNEIALEVRGFRDCEDASRAAREVLARFMQEGVLIIDEDHDGTLVTAEGTERLGYMCLTTDHPALFGVRSFTSYGDGLHLYSAHDRTAGCKLAA